MLDPARDARITTMFKRDVAAAGVLAVTMWTTLLFTYWAAFSVIDNPTVNVALAIALLLLGLFNSLGLLSMSRRYRVEREHVYGEDIHHLDANWRARQAHRAALMASAA